MTPNSQFPGLKPGNYWCICILAWLRAHKEGINVEIKIKSSHEKVNYMLIGGQDRIFKDFRDYYGYQ